MKFDGKLEIGMLAMIINTRHEANRSLIGKIVTIEEIPAIGDDVSHLFPTATNVIRENHPDIVICSGASAPYPSVTSRGDAVREGYVRLASKNLMPLPPLDEEEFAKERELEMS